MRVMTDIGSRLVFNGKTHLFDHVRAPYEERLRALAMQERALGKDHPNVAITLLILGDACKGAGDNKSAKEFYERSLGIREKHFAEWSGEVAECKERIRDLRKKET